MFWYYFEPNPAIPVVKEENGFPCKRLKDFINNGFLFNIMYYKKNVIMECFHEQIREGKSVKDLFEEADFYASVK